MCPSNALPLLGLKVRAFDCYGRPHLVKLKIHDKCRRTKKLYWINQFFMGKPFPFEYFNRWEHI